jgi:hypothetical protein
VIGRKPRNALWMGYPECEPLLQPLKLPVFTGLWRRRAAHSQILLHILGNFQPPKAFDLSLRRTGPQCVGSQFRVRAQTLDENAHARCAYARRGGERGGDEMTHISVTLSKPYWAELP